MTVLLEYFVEFYALVKFLSTGVYGHQLSDQYLSIINVENRGTKIKYVITK